jgi:putative acetyltransferase
LKKAIKDMNIRAERTADIESIHALNALAFDGAGEADLVDALRAQVDTLVSLVADDKGEVAGHILFSPVTLSGKESLTLFGLAPMAVTPKKQRNGIGSLLVNVGIEACRALGGDGVVVLGHPNYYPRFGFAPSTKYGFCSEYDVPDDVFMAMELRDDAFLDVSGVIAYHPVFAGI